MKEYRIRGQNPINGTIGAAGAKNAALPILAAVVLCKGESVIHNCPHIADINLSAEILRGLGCSAEFEKNCLRVDSRQILTAKMPTDLVCKMRSSVLFMGAMLGRMGEVIIAGPGGCNIGARPIDMHLDGLRKMGVKITEENGLIHAKVKKLRGASIILREISVGATENLMLAAALAEGETILTNAAREPEIVDLARFLNSAGAQVFGAGTSTVRITGVSELKGATHRIMPDRIVTGTFALAAAMTGGDITLTGINNADIKPTIAALLAMGCKINEKPGSLRVRAPRILRPVHITTEAHPGFPTDMQAPFVAALALAKGTSIIEERIFEARAAHAAELIRMGAHITLTTDERVFIIKGKKHLTAARVHAGDLRGGAALILAGLAAYGTTIVVDPGYVERGYERLTECLISLGAEIYEAD
jgi:UDP-N-acetylglucosamine 1-carboxyvinyltransferase